MSDISLDVAAFYGRAKRIFESWSVRASDHRADPPASC